MSDTAPSLPVFLLARIAAEYQYEEFRKVLVDLDAKRRIVELHTLTVSRSGQSMFDPFTGARRADEYDVLCEVCGWVSPDPSGGCETLCLLALPYADHPDYRQEWTP